MPDILHAARPDPRALALEAAAGLLARVASLSPKFLYDRLGSRLFDAITELPEYYPTRTEAAIFDAHQTEMAAAIHMALGPGLTMIELGAGSCDKAAALFPVLQPARFVAVDISADHLGSTLQALQQQHPQIQMLGLAMDFSTRLALPPQLLQTGRPALVFYPGSSIGNFAPDAALRLLREAREAAAGGALLVGVDGRKPAAVLHAAYDDALGVTAAFNLNLLRHVNTVLGSDFDVRQWQHRAEVDSDGARVRMHLVAKEALSARWLQPDGTPAQRDFAAGEAIHTEDSHKWRRDDFIALLHDAGWREVRGWSDAQQWFHVLLAQG